MLGKSELSGMEQISPTCKRWPRRDKYILNMSSFELDAALRTMKCKRKDLTKERSETCVNTNARCSALVFVKQHIFCCFCSHVFSRHFSGALLKKDFVVNCCNESLERVKEF